MVTRRKAITIFDPRFDDLRPVTQEDVDRLQDAAHIMAMARNAARQIEDATHQALKDGISASEFRDRLAALNLVGLGLLRPKVPDLPRRTPLNG